MVKKLIVNLTIFNLILFSTIYGDEPRILTLEESLKIAFEKSFDIKRAEQDLIRDRENLKAARAALRSNAHMNFFVPTFSTPSVCTLCRKPLQKVGSYAIVCARATFASKTFVGYSILA